MKTIRAFILLIFTYLYRTITRTTGIPCQGFQGPCKSKNATRQPQNTAYVKEERNWVTMCPRCAADNEAEWAERWAEYYSGCR